MFYTENQGFVRFTVNELNAALNNAGAVDDYCIQPFIHPEHGFLFGVFTSAEDGCWYVGSVNPVTGEFYPVQERGKDDGIHPVYGPLYSLKDDGETLVVSLHPRRARK